MKTADVAEFKRRLREYLAAVANGEEVEIRERNVPLARVVPAPRPARNRTVLGCGRGSVVVRASLVEPLIPSADWEVLEEESRLDSVSPSQPGDQRTERKRAARSSAAWSTSPRRP